MWSRLAYQFQTLNYYPMTLEFFGKLEVTRDNYYFSQIKYQILQLLLSLKLYNQKWIQMRESMTLKNRVWQYCNNWEASTYMCTHRHTQTSSQQLKEIYIKNSFGMTVQSEGYMSGSCWAVPPTLTVRGCYLWFLIPQWDGVMAKTFLSSLEEGVNGWKDPKV